MAYPKAEASRQERYDYIAKSAAELVALRGLEALSIRAVAEQAGCSRGLVEHYFKHKASLIAAAHDWVNKAYLERVARIPAQRTGLAALEARIRQLLPFNTEILNEWRVRIVYWRQASTDAKFRELHQQRFEEVFEGLMTAISDAVVAKEIDERLDPMMTAELIVFYVIGFVTACLNDARLRKKSSLEARIRLIKSMLKSGSLLHMREDMQGAY